MTLNDDQKRSVAQWIEQGLKLSDIQKRLVEDFGIRLTFMEVKLLVGDLNLMPKDPSAGRLEKPGKAPQPLAQPRPSEPEGKPPEAGRVTVTVDELTQPGTLASGQVTFSDGNKAVWAFDELGRLQVIPRQRGYQPSEQDVRAFQSALQNELARLGF